MKKYTETMQKTLTSQQNLLLKKMIYMDTLIMDGDND